MSAGMVVATPSTTISPSARSMRRSSGLAVDAPDDELADEVVVVLADLVAGCVSAVQAHAEAVGHDELGDAAGGGEESPAGRVLGVDAASRWRGLAAGSTSWSNDSGTPDATRICSATRSMPVTSSVTGCSTCSRVFISRKKNSPSWIQELDGARVRVADRSCDRHRRLAHRLRVSSEEAGAGLSSMSFWWRRCAEQSALADPHHVAVGVADDLHLDVARPREVALDVDLGAPEVRLGLALRRLDRGLDVARTGHDLHAAPAPAVCRLHSHRPTVALAERDALRPVT